MNKLKWWKRYLKDLKTTAKNMRKFLNILFCDWRLFTRLFGRALEWRGRGQEFDPLRLHQKIRQVSTCRIFLSIAKAMAYHQGRLVALVSHQSVRAVYHHTFRCVSKMLSQWWYTKLCFDDMQFLAELMIYKAYALIFDETL